MEYFYVWAYFNAHAFLNAGLASSDISTCTQEAWALPSLLNIAPAYTTHSKRELISPHSSHLKDQRSLVSAAVTNNWTSESVIIQKANIFLPTSFSVYLNSIYFAVAGPAGVNPKPSFSMWKLQSGQKAPLTLISDLDQKPHSQSEVVRARWMDSAI